MKQAEIVKKEKLAELKVRTEFFKKLKYIFNV